MRLSSTRRRRYRYDYYTIRLPSDLVAEDHPDWAEKMMHHAIYQAREQVRLKCIPCNWQSQLIQGDKDSFECVFKVRRKRFVSQEARSE